MDDDLIYFYQCLSHQPRIATRLHAVPYPFPGSADCYRKLPIEIVDLPISTYVYLPIKDGDFP